MALSRLRLAPTVANHTYLDAGVEITVFPPGREVHTNPCAKFNRKGVGPLSESTPFFEYSEQIFRVFRANFYLAQEMTDGLHNSPLSAAILPQD